MDNAVIATLAIFGGITAVAVIAVLMVFCLVNGHQVLAVAMAFAKSRNSKDKRIKKLWLRIGALEDEVLVYKERIENLEEIASKDI